MNDTPKTLTARLVCFDCKAETDLEGTKSEIARRLLKGIPCPKCGSLATAIMAPKEEGKPEVPEV